MTIKSWPGPHSMNSCIEMALARADHTPERIATDLHVTVDRVRAVAARMDQIVAEDAEVDA